MKLKTFIIMGFISTSCLGGCAQRPDPLGEKTIELDDFDFSTPHYGHFSRPLYKHRVGRELVSDTHPQHRGRRGRISISKRNLHRLL